MNQGTSFPNRIDEIKRYRPKQRDGLAIDDIRAKKSGNYIFSFGFPGSGKTTFQWMLMNYLMNEGPFRTEISVPDGPEGQDWEGRAIINMWKDQWIEGRLPDPNATGENAVREVMIDTRTTNGRKIHSKFGFLEMSGELLQEVLVKPGAPPPVMAPLLHAYLDNPNLRFCVVLMLSPDIEENDKLFASFMTYLKKNFRGLLDRISLAVVISKPKESLERLREFGASDGQTVYDKLDKDALLDYLNRFCGETYQIWDHWPEPKKTLLSPLHLGELDMSGGELRLVKPSFRHIEEILFWLIEQFEGKRPGPTLFQRILGRVNRWK
ncbi:MAG: hypothetical protein GDA49_12900 [Rhodospirillales bacterium]|nr:hypothetical protein [Rhodospirillales bacterium]